MSDTHIPPAPAAGVPTNAIADAVGRLEDLVGRRAGFGHATQTSVTTLDASLSCSSEEGPWRIDSDMPKAFGGSAAAPSPGALLRAALGSCLAIGYTLRAARHGVELSSLRVTVEADSELAGMLDPACAAPPGWTEFRYHVEVASPASAAEVQHVLDEGDRLSPLLDALARTNRVHRTTAIRTGGELA